MKAIATILAIILWQKPENSPNPNIKVVPCDLVRVRGTPGKATLMLGDGVCASTNIKPVTWKITCFCHNFWPGLSEN